MDLATTILIGFAVVFLAALYVVAFKTPRSPDLRAGDRARPELDAVAGPPPAQDTYEVRERSSMPEEIALGRLVASERTFRRRGPRGLFAKVDQAFRTPAGLLVLVETKSRMRLQTSDIVQLSAQAVAVRSEVGDRLGRVADYAYVRMQLLGGPAQYRPVRLYPEAVIDQLVDRYQALRMRRVYPLARPHPSRCGTCVFKSQCRS